MEDFIEDWKKITTNTIAENGAFIHNKNKTIMTAIINYEKKEIKGRESVKMIIYFLVPFFIATTAFQVWVGTTEITTINLIGYALMLFGLAFSYFNNRTDNFPDVRLLSTVDYLNKVQQTIQARTKQHTFNSLILLLFYIPGMFCCFINYFTKAEIAPYLNSAIPYFLVLVSALLLKTRFDTLKKYKLETQPLTEELEGLILEMD